MRPRCRQVAGLVSASKHCASGPASAKYVECPPVLCLQLDPLAVTVGAYSERRRWCGPMRHDDICFRPHRRATRFDQSMCVVHPHAVTACCYFGLPDSLGASGVLGTGLTVWRWEWKELEFCLRNGSQSLGTVHGILGGKFTSAYLTHAGGADVSRHQ